jgi:hypothetical protein
MQAFASWQRGPLEHLSDLAVLLGFLYFPVISWSVFFSQC